MKTIDGNRIYRVPTGESCRVITSDIVLIAPSQGVETLLDSKHPVGRKNELTLESTEAMINFRTVKVVDRISHWVAMWIYTEEDTIAPIEESRNMYRKVQEPKKLVGINEFKHYELYHGPGLESMMTRTTECFGSHL